MPVLTPEQRLAVEQAIGRDGYARIENYVVVKAEVYGLDSLDSRRICGCLDSLDSRRICGCLDSHRWSKKRWSQKPSRPAS